VNDGYSSRVTPSCQWAQIGSSETCNDHFGEYSLPSVAQACFDIQEPDPDATSLTWDSVNLSEMEEPDYEYLEHGYAYILVDKFTGANVLENHSMVDGADTAILAQVEPYDFDLTDELQQIMQIPSWQPKEGDLFALLINPNLVLWLELVGMSGQTFMADFGKKYVFNKRDDLSHLEPFKTEFDNRI